MAGISEAMDARVRRAVSCVQLKKECLSRIVFFEPASLQQAVRQFMTGRRLEVWMTQKHEGSQFSRRLLHRRGEFQS
jgi:hypothetical protein